MTRPQSFGRILRGALTGALAFASVAVVAGGCLDRPVAPATPTVSARIVTPAKQNKVSKIDLLFMIDNSSSMADKQAILANAVPDLVTRLVNPVCIDPITGMQTGQRNQDGSCTRGEPDFDPIKNIHIGIITSSLGAHGATGVCDDAMDQTQMRSFPHNNDASHLVARDVMDMPVTTFMGQGFLNWNPVLMMGQQPADIATPFQTMVRGVGQHGCGYEASLEAIYRFLIEPDPYQSIMTQPTPTSTLGTAMLVGTDMTLLQQRYDFLRPDSLVAVMMITDENDCSVVDVGQGFYSITPPQDIPPASVLGHGTSTCLTDPNHKCCFNCGQRAPDGCADPAGDTECMKGRWPAAEDPVNLRCWDQKRRYGVDFLYPVGRYINGFRNNRVPDRMGNPVKNPLYDDLTPECRVMKTGCLGERDRSLVFVAGIIGVPWQDIAVDPTDLTKGYLTATQINDMNIWPKILGDPTTSPPVAPSDKHMIESVLPRQGLPGPNSAANAGPLHGHEWDPSMDPRIPNSDLQYACIFDLTTPKTCSTIEDCDCYVPMGGQAGATMNPLCQNRASNQYTNVQSRAKGYPGLRHLQMLQGLQEQAIIASICPSNVTNMTASDFGYRPAIAALISRLRNALRGRCLPRQLAVTDDGRVPCVIVEAFNPPAGASCTCSEAGRLPALQETITPEVRAQGSCFCEIKQLRDGEDPAHPNAGTVCQTFPSPPGDTPAGWCYVDPSQTGNAQQCQIVRNCPATERRIIRFVNPDSEPRAGATAFIMCQEKSFPSTGGPMDPCP